MKNVKSVSVCTYYCTCLLGNNRSALNDATAALKHKPDHMKAIIRGTITCFDLERYEECITWCEKGLKISFQF